MKTIKSVIIVFGIIMCFSVIVSASLYDDFNRLKNTNCTLTDYGKLSFSTTALQNKFNLVSINRPCNFILDYPPLENKTLNVSGGIVIYGDIIHIIDMEGIEYIVLLGKNESVLEKVVDLIANYENNSILLKDYEDFVVVDDFYFELYESGNIPEPVFPEGCTDNPLADTYSSNQGFYGAGAGIPFDSFCVENYLLAFPYCEANQLQYTDFVCDNCVNNKCIANSREVFNIIKELGETNPKLREGTVSLNFLDSVVDSWLNN